MILLELLLAVAVAWALRRPVGVPFRPFAIMLAAAVLAGATVDMPDQDVGSSYRRLIVGALFLSAIAEYAWERLQRRKAEK